MVVGMTTAIRHGGAFLGDNSIICRSVLVVSLGGNTICESLQVALLRGSTIWGAIGEGFVGSDNRTGADSPDDPEHSRR